MTVIHGLESVDLADVDYLLTDYVTPESELVDREETQNLFACMRKLSFADKEIINLNHFRMMSYDEIASLLNIPKGTVMSRIFYAKQALAKAMGGKLKE